MSNPALTDYYYAINADGTIQGKVSALQMKALFSLNQPIKTFLIPLTVNMFNDVSNTSKAVDVGKLPLGYKFIGAIAINNEMWTGGAASGVSVSIRDTVSNNLINTFQMQFLSSPSNAQEIAAVGAGSGLVSSIITVDGDGLEGITIEIDCDVNLDQLVNGAASIYIIANQMIYNLESLIP